MGLLTGRMSEEPWRSQLETLPNRGQKVRRDRQTGFEILKDESLVLQLLPLCHCKWRPTHFSLLCFCLLVFFFLFLFLILLLPLQLLTNTPKNHLSSNNSHTHTHTHTDYKEKRSRKSEKVRRLPWSR